MIVCKTKESDGERETEKEVWWWKLWIWIGKSDERLGCEKEREKSVDVSMIGDWR